MFHTLAEKCNALTSPFICQVRYEMEKLHSLTFLVTLRSHGKKKYYQQEKYDHLQEETIFPQYCILKPNPTNRLIKFC